MRLIMEECSSSFPMCGILRMISKSSVTIESMEITINFLFSIMHRLSDIEYKLLVCLRKIHTLIFINFSYY